MEVVWRVAEGRTDPLDFAKKRAHLPGDCIPDSLAAVVRKAMALEPSARYQIVADLQADIAAYQNGFATSAEKADAWKQFTFFVKRNQAASIGVAAALVLSAGFPRRSSPRAGGPRSYRPGGHSAAMSCEVLPRLSAAQGRLRH